MKTEKTRMHLKLALKKEMEEIVSSCSQELSNHLVVDMLECLYEKLKLEKYEA